MHGVKRARVTPQAAEAKRLRELGKIEAYVTLEEDVLSRKRAKDYSREALDKTTQLLDLNPEFFTIWNYRRQILLALFPNLEPEEIVSQLTTELRLTTAYLQVHPKVYWIWTHRKWCLEAVPLGPNPTSSAGTDPSGSGGPSSGLDQGKGEGKGQVWRETFWKGELKLVEKMLDVDARNFHAWDYRRYILSSLPVPRPAKDELRYTQSKIESNFSNFSAWHCRTKVLSGVWEGMDDDTEVAKAKDEEFELVTQALWTDPGDSSGWLYHRWLIGADPPVDILQREMTNIQDLYEAEPESKWCMDALAHYTLLLAAKPSTSPEQVSKLKDGAKSLYRKLEEVDPDRKARYKDQSLNC